MASPVSAEWRQMQSMVEELVAPKKLLMKEQEFPQDDAEIQNDK